ncbi:uncharacterized protein LOC111716022 [Eurytemora carolleeae]|uniref:uncharacterized protein LOC111716022 n=1 Tax=Eurytemora carolleeae TaxID=1294199 RepID=UPI000C77F884|nr:uncharacterized protein LOC111716022 [Eurytemora carolleeae]|eukprot:XP_023347202.1 uncharacterized protein LOC111716022 [Eurytemora affinis]
MADGRPTKAWGSRTILLQFGNRRFQFSFLLADVDCPILGADFLAEFDLLVDASKQQVLERASRKPLSSPVMSTANPAVASVFKLAPDVSSLLKEFPAAWEPRQPGQLPAHKVEHVIETYGQPLFARARRLDQAKLESAKAEFRKMEEAGIIRRSDSPWAFPLHMVPKPDEIDYLGHKITATGIVPLRRHVEALLQLPRPQDVCSLQRFLGMVNFYRRFLPGIAKILRLLTDALAGNPKSLNWSETHQESFEKAKSALSSAVPLTHPSPSVSLVTDAFASHVGAVLQERKKSNWRPLAFFSAKLSATQQRYSAFDRELLGVFLALRQFRFELEGRKFHIITDHLPLVSALFQVSPPWSARQQRQLSNISEFTSDIRHTPGSANVVADYLSRPSPPSPCHLPFAHPPEGQVSEVSGVSEVSEVTDSSLPSPFPTSAKGINFEELASDQRSCPEVLRLQRSPSLRLVKNGSLLCDASDNRRLDAYPPVNLRPLPWGGGVLWKTRPGGLLTQRPRIKKRA